MLSSLLLSVLSHSSHHECSFVMVFVHAMPVTLSRKCTPVTILAYPACHALTFAPCTDSQSGFLFCRPGDSLCVPAQLLPDQGLQGVQSQLVCRSRADRHRANHPWLAAELWNPSCAQRSWVGCSDGRHIPCKALLQCICCCAKTHCQTSISLTAKTTLP